MKLWIEDEDGSFSRTLWVCCKAHGISPYPTHFLGEFGLSPDRADRSINDYVGNATTTWDTIVSNIYGLTTFSYSPDPAFRAVMVWKNVFSLLTRFIRQIRLRGAPANARRKRCIFRIHALVALLSRLMKRLSAENAIPCLSQALRKGLVELLSSTILTASLTDTERNGIDYLRQCLFSHLLLSREVIGRCCW